MSRRNISKRTQVVLLGTPVVPPWDHGSKNLMRDLATHAQDVDVRMPVLSRNERIPNAKAWCAAASPAIQMWKATKINSVDMFHAFFSPTPKNRAALSILSAIRRKPIIHTLPSLPAELRFLAHGSDLLVVLSEFSKNRLLKAGLPAERVHVVYPSVPKPSTVARAQRATNKKSTILYAGDLEFGGALDHFIESWIPLRHKTKALVATRNKTSESKRLRQAYRRSLPADFDIEFLGKVPSMDRLLDRVDLLFQPMRSTAQKTDFPLIVMEALSKGIPVLTTSKTATSELKPYGVRLSNSVRESTGLLKDFLCSDWRLSQTQRQEFLQYFSAERVARSYEQLYGLLSG